MQTIGERIKLKRKELHMTQTELAQKLNLTGQAVSKWEQGEGNPDIYTLPKLAELFGVTADYLLTGTEPPKSDISLDDLDETRRKFYLIERDDAENFSKYGYDKPQWTEEYGNLLPLEIEEVYTAIYKHGARKIFALCAGKMKNGYTKRLEKHLDGYVRMCARLGRRDLLEKIWFPALFSPDGTRTDFHPGPWGGYFHVSTKLLDKVLNDPDTPAEIADFLFDPRDKDAVYDAYLLKKACTSSRYSDRLDGLLGYFSEQADAAMEYAKSRRYEWKRGEKVACYCWTWCEYASHLAGGENKWIIVVPEEFILCLALNGKKAIAEKLRGYHKKLASADDERGVYNENVFVSSRVEGYHGIFDEYLGKYKLGEDYRAYAYLSYLIYRRRGGLGRGQGAPGNKLPGTARFVFPLTSDEEFKEKLAAEKKREEVDAYVADGSHSAYEKALKKLEIDPLLDPADLKQMTAEQADGLLEKHPVFTIEIVVRLIEEENWAALSRYTFDPKTGNPLGGFTERFVKFLSEKNANALKGEACNLDYTPFGRDISPLIYVPGRKGWDEPDPPATYENIMRWIGAYKRQLVAILSARENQGTDKLTRAFFEKEMERGHYELVAANLCVRLEEILRADRRLRGDFSELISIFIKTIDRRTGELLSKLYDYRNSFDRQEPDAVTMTSEELETCIDYICGLVE